MESDLGGIGGRSAGLCFLCSGGLLAADTADLWSKALSCPVGILNGL